MKNEKNNLKFLQRIGILIFILGFVVDAVLQFFGKAPEVSIFTGTTFPAFWAVSVVGLLFIASPIFPYAWELWQKRKR